MKILGILLGFIMSLAVLSPVPAQAAGNFECGPGAGGTSVCVQTTVRRSVLDRRVWVVRLDVWSSGDNSSLEGGSCSGNPAVDIKDLSIISADQKTLWGPKLGNLCKANGYSRSYKISNLRVRCNKAYVHIWYKSRNNFGLDKEGEFAVHVETC